MSDSAGFWRDFKEVLTPKRKLKKEQNRIQSTETLQHAGVVFTSHNNGLHLIIKLSETDRVDFWPSTGTWWEKNGKRGRGVQPLLNYINKRSRQILAQRGN